jgi:uncharacterized membrane protein
MIKEILLRKFMSKKITITAIGAVIALGIHIQTNAEQSNNTQGMEKCYGVCKAGKNDCGNAAGSCSASSRVDNDKNAWIVVPRGTCSKIVGGHTQP